MKPRRNRCFSGQESEKLTIEISCQQDVKAVVVIAVVVVVVVVAVAVTVDNRHDVPISDTPKLL